MARQWLDSPSDLVWRGCGRSIVGEAGNPLEVRDQILSKDPGVLTLDIENVPYQRRNILTCLMKYLPKPVVVMSALATPGSDVERRARAARAFEVFDKGRLELQGRPQIIRQVLAQGAAARGLDQARLRPHRTRGS